MGRPSNTSCVKTAARNLWRLALISSSSLQLSTLLATPVAAQSAPLAPAGPGNIKTLPEIVVTAEKRQSTVQKTPISITAIGEKQLAQRGIGSIEDVVQQVAGVSFRSAGPGQTELEIRGLSSTGGAAPTVGYYLDETPLTPPVQALNGKVVVDPAIFDVQRVEVLRGPQGTLYGSGSMGGTIRILTNQPNLTRLTGAIEAEGSYTQHGGPNGTLNAFINIPLIDDKLALRIVGTEKYDSGFIDRVVVNPFPLPTNIGCAPTAFYGCARGDVSNAPVTKRYDGVNWLQERGSRAELKAQPNDKLTILVSGMYQALNQGGANTFDSPPGNQLVHFQPIDISEPISDKFWVASGSISYDLGWATLTSSTSYWNRESSAKQDQAEGFQTVYQLPAFNLDPDQFVTERDKSNQISSELRLASTGDGNLKWIIGGFYSHLKSQYHEFADSPYCAFAVGGCVPEPSSVPIDQNPNGVAIDVTVPYDITQNAIFGEASYRITPQITTTVGARYSSFNNSLTTNVAGIFGPSGNGNFVQLASSGTDQAFTPKFNISYIPNSDLTIYGTISKGFRPGGVNQPLPLTGPNSCEPFLNAIGLDQAPETYKPDSIWNYELGEKARLFDRRVTLNADLFYITWQNIQQSINLPCGTPYADNVGSAQAYGPEVELSIALTDHLTLDGNFVYTEAEITNAAPNTGYVAGEDIDNVPRFTQNTMLTYRTDFGDGTSLTGSLNGSVIGPVSDVALSRVELPTYAIVNTRVTYDRGPNKVKVAFFVNNIGNKHAELTANNTSVSFNIPSLIRFSTNQPRTVGLNLRYDF